jgi:hypothetical protein
LCANGCRIVGLGQSPTGASALVRATSLRQLSVFANCSEHAGSVDASDELLVEISQTIAAARCWLLAYLREKRIGTSIAMPDR